MVTVELLRRGRLRRSLPSPDIARELRRRAGLTLEDVAAELAVSRSTVSRWETGARRPSGERVIAYAALLKTLRRDQSGQHDRGHDRL